MLQSIRLLCVLDPGTRESTVAEARARVPEAQARVSEARARLVEAEISDNAARRLGEDGFASETRVASARAGVESALAGVEAAEAGVEAARAGVAAAEKEFERLQIKAPFAGLLESDTAELGALMQPGATCATIFQLDPIKLVGFVPETDVDKVTVGAMAGARLATGREVRGEVTFLSRSADPTTRTFRVEVLVPNADLLIRDGHTRMPSHVGNGNFAGIHNRRSDQQWTGDLKHDHGAQNDCLHRRERSFIAGHRGCRQCQRRSRLR